MATANPRPTRCKICQARLVGKQAAIDHIEKEHVAMIPEGWSSARFECYLRTGKTEGKCIYCKKPTKWNPATGKYNRMCGEPACKKKAYDMAQKNYIGKHGKVYTINDPEQQKKMVYGKKNSGTYVFEDEDTGKKYEAMYDSSYGRDFFEMIDTFLNWDGADIIAPSPHTYYYKYEGKEHFYIPDAYSTSLNLEIELKDGGDNPNLHPKIQSVDKVKEKLKDEVMASLKDQVNYIKICNKDYAEFFALLSRLRAQDRCPLPKWESKLEPALESMGISYENILESSDPLKVKTNLIKRNRLLVDPMLNYDSLLLYYRNKLFHEKLKPEQWMALEDELQHVKEHLQGVVNGNSEEDKRMNFEAKKALVEVNRFLEYMQNVTPVKEFDKVVTETRMITHHVFKLSHNEEPCTLDGVPRDINLIDHTNELPIKLSYFPNNMGINLCSVDSIEWDETADKARQIVYMLVKFDPDTEAIDAIEEQFTQKTGVPVIENTAECNPMVIMETGYQHDNFLYHLSREKYSDGWEGHTLAPSVPSNFMTKNGCEDSETKRVCFSPTISQCLTAMSENLKGKTLYVYAASKTANAVDTQNTNPGAPRYVPDCHITGEKWVLEPVKVYYVGTIKVEGSYGEGLPYNYGDNKTAELYYWKYSWVGGKNRVYLNPETSTIEATIEHVIESVKDPNRPVIHKPDLTQAGEELDFKKAPEQMVESASTLLEDFKPKGHKSLSIFKMEPSNSNKVQRLVEEGNETLKFVASANDGRVWFDKDDNVVAMVGIDKSRHPYWIYDLVVSEKYRGYGLGKQVLDYTVKELGGEALTVRKDNNIAIRMYDKYGFVSKPVKNGEKGMTYMYLTESTVYANTLYHGSHISIPGNTIDPKNKSREADNYVFGTPDREFALCYAGNPWHDGMMNQSYYNGQLTLTEMKPGVFKKIFDTDGFIYSIDTKDNTKFVSRSPHVYLTTESVNIANRERIVNVWNEIQKSGIELHIYPNKPAWWKTKLDKDVMEMSMSSDKSDTMIFMTDGKSNSVTESIEGLDDACKYVRVSYNGSNEGIYEEYRKSISVAEWHNFLNSQAAKWLKKPSIIYKNTYMSYFTLTGYNKFCEYTLPVISKTLNPDNILIHEVFTEIQDKYRVVYKDADQIVIDAGPLTEGFVFKQKDILYNKEAFDNGDINLCFVTGHSGSGKSTFGLNATKGHEDTVDTYSLDDLMCVADHFTMEQLKQYGELIYAFFNGPGKKFYVKYDELIEKKIPGSEYEDKLYPTFVNFAKGYAKSHKDKKFIIEGVWLFCNDDNGKPYFKPEDFKDYAFYIKGTSAIVSKFRAAKRDSEYEGGTEKVKKGFDRLIAFSKDFFLRNWKWYALDEKRINVFREYFKNKPETAVSEAKYIEATKEDNHYYPVFIFLSYTGTNMAKLIKSFTHDPYAHSSISFDTNLDNMISFNREGMVIEDIRKSVYKKNEDSIRYSLYMYMATAAEYDSMQNFVNELLARKSDLKYNFLGLTNFIFGRGSSREDKFFCSEFVASVINAGNNRIIKTQPYMTSPYNLAKNKNFVFIKTGILKHYDQKVIDKIIAEKLEEGGFSDVIIE